MKLLKESRRSRPKVSLILLDWSVRESFHLMHYLGRQDVPRDDFEVMIIEYHSRVSPALRPFEDMVDTWLLMEMPEDCYYHKHVMYNAGIALARGEICVICDSDAMVKPGFIRAIVEAFEREPDLVLHLDQFRNNRRDFYPFNYPSFEQVEGDGCINNIGGRTRGVLEVEDPIHARNYGACMCARRSDLIAIGGADEHIDYLGHICGPYDMTFRLFNRGHREVWHPTEFMYHTWHPGQAGADNYLGPHDGRHVSTTAIEALVSRRVMPLVESTAIRKLREGSAGPGMPAPDDIVAPANLVAWKRENLDQLASGHALPDAGARTHYYKGFGIRKEAAGFHARLLIEAEGAVPGGSAAAPAITAGTLEEARAEIDRAMPGTLGITLSAGRLYVLGRLLVEYAVLRTLKKMFGGAAVVPAADGHQPAARGFAASLVSAGARLKARIGQFRQEVSWVGDALADILSNLFFTRRARPELLARGAPMLLLESHRFYPYLKLLAALRIIPKIRLECIRTSRQLEEFLARPGSAQPAGATFIARSIYVRYYPQFAPGDRIRNATVI